MKFEDFLNSVEIKDQIQVNRNTEGCCYWFKEHRLFHERTNWGAPKPSLWKTPAQKLHGILTEPNTWQWTNSCYIDKQLAEKDAKQWGGYVQKDFYCEDENPTYFLAFEDNEKALRFCYDKLEIDKL